ncbi:MAG: energy-coupling factor ABC transporter permease [bacterium]
MHAPDGVYSNSLCLIMDLASAGILAYSLRKVWKRVGTREILLASAVGAFSFALELASFEVTRGSTCHFMGGVFASIVLGPYLATTVMTLEHIIQVFLFQDGGIMALGPNLLTIVCISTFGGYYIYSLLKNFVIEPYGSYISAFLSAWLTLLVTSLTVCGMLSVCGIEEFFTTLGPMVGPHVKVGVAEGMLTVLLLFVIQVLAPDAFNCRSLHQKEQQEQMEKPEQKTRKCWRHQNSLPKSAKKVAYVLLGLALMVSLAISPFASRSAEGLEKFALDRGHPAPHRIIIHYQAPIPEYHLPGVRDQEMAKILGGTIGTIATFAACMLALSIIRAGSES